MGRIGAGEMMTWLFGAVGPLVSLIVVGALIAWSLRLRRQGRGPTATAAFYGSIAALVAPLLGVLATAIALSAAFASIAEVPVAGRAATLAERIGAAMGTTVAGIVVGGSAFVIALGCAIHASRRPPRA